MQLKQLVKKITLSQEDYAEKFEPIKIYINRIKPYENLSTLLGAVDLMRGPGPRRHSERIRDTRANGLDCWLNS